MCVCVCLLKYQTLNATWKHEFLFSRFLLKQNPTWENGYVPPDESQPQLRKVDNPFGVTNTGLFMCLICRSLWYPFWSNTSVKFSEGSTLVIIFLTFFIYFFVWACICCVFVCLSVKREKDFRGWVLNFQCSNWTWHLLFLMQQFIRLMKN